MMAWNGKSLLINLPFPSKSTSAITKKIKLFLITNIQQSVTFIYFQDSSVLNINLDKCSTFNKEQTEQFKKVPSDTQTQ